MTRAALPRILLAYTIKDIIMDAIHAGITIGVTELRESPTRILKRAEDEDQAVAILNHNKPAGYIVSPKMMEAMLDSIADYISEKRAKSRISTLSKARKIKLDELWNAKLQLLILDNARLKQDINYPMLGNYKLDFN